MKQTNPLSLVLSPALSYMQSELGKKVGLTQMLISAFSKAVTDERIYLRIEDLKPGEYADLDGSKAEYSESFIRSCMLSLCGGPKPFFKAHYYLWGMEVKTMNTWHSIQKIKSHPRWGSWVSWSMPTEIQLHIDLEAYKPFPE